MSAENEPPSASTVAEPPAPANSIAPTATETSDKPFEAVAESSEVTKDAAESSTVPAIDSEPAPVDESQPDIDDTTMTEPPTAAADAEEGNEEGVNTAASSKKPKRKSSTSVPEHKGKKLSRKSSTAGKNKVLQLDAKPGDYYWARLKGYPPWPAMICDEEMLPETLLASRPVTAMRPDGTYRADFEDGGKKAKDRTYPVMYLYTNEFSWMPNVDLKPLDLDEVKQAEQGSKGKTLWNAYLVAREGHDLQYFKNLLIEHETAIEEAALQAAQEEAAKEAAKEAKAAEKKAKKEKRKSKSADNDKDVSMVDADEDGAAEGGSAKKPRSSKKRKKTDGEADEAEAPVKTPKTSLKLKTAKDKDAESKPKSKKSAVPAEPQLSEEELRERKEKEVLYLRHKLQKTFVSRDKPPEDEKMPEMSDLFSTLEALHRNLDVAIIRTTKINKVLKAIIKVPHIPRESEFNFRKRSVALLEGWNKALAEDTTHSPVIREMNGTDKPDEAAETPKAPETTGEAEDGKDDEGGIKADEVAASNSVTAAPAAASIGSSDSTTTATKPTTNDISILDTSMTDAPPTESVAPNTTSKIDSVATATEVPVEIPTDTNATGVGIHNEPAAVKIPTLTPANDVSAAAPVANTVSVVTESEK